MSRLGGCQAKSSHIIVDNNIAVGHIMKSLMPIGGNN
jgi:hypothetical protein